MFYESFPKEYIKDLEEVLKIIPESTYSIKNKIEYISNGNIIKIPYRVYFKDIDNEKLNNLTDIQKIILYCIYTRNDNGCIREKYIRELLNIDFDYWVIPFIVKISDEYIVEILEVIYNKLKNRDNSDIKKFCLENKDAMKKSYSRMVSYWNEYYRNIDISFRDSDNGKFNLVNSYSKVKNRFNDYVGKKLFVECFGYNKSFEK